jgi:hypothetical protein
MPVPHQSGAGPQLNSLRSRDIGFCLQFVGKRIELALGRRTESAEGSLLDLPGNTDFDHVAVHELRRIRLVVSSPRKAKLPMAE